MRVRIWNVWKFCAVHTLLPIQTNILRGAQREGLATEPLLHTVPIPRLILAKVPEDIFPGKISLHRHN